jgi:hypothetical protein
VSAGDGRWTLGLAIQLQDVLEHAGYRRGDDTHVSQARHLLHLAASVYAGETQPPTGPADVPQVSLGEAAAVDAAWQAVAAYEAAGGTDGVLAVLGTAPDRDQAARCARAFGHAVDDLRRVLGLVEDLTGDAS